jgi:2-polyprenyl-6-methoxyphenol hydroxylase-like FAD-dependent oxidoreductase
VNVDVDVNVNECNNRPRSRSRPSCAPDISDRAPSARWGEGRVTLLGDAAHPMTPNVGQGACQAIEDALALAEELPRAASIEAGLRA